jgi:hypothetical protein
MQNKFLQTSAFALALGLSITVMGPSMADCPSGSYMLVSSYPSRVACLGGFLDRRFNPPLPTLACGLIAKKNGKGFVGCYPASQPPVQNDDNHLWACCVQ